MGKAVRTAHIVEERSDSMAEDITIGFIGYGNMAQAVAQGLVDQGVVDGGRIVACAAHLDKLRESTARIGARAMKSAEEVVAAADVVVVAVKPGMVREALDGATGELSDPRRMVVSIVGGWSLESYRGVLEPRAHVQCAIPNTPIAVGQGVLIAETANTLSAEQSELFERLFSPVALIERVDSDHLGVATILGGCAPAFAEMFLEALADGGVEFGLSRATSYRLASKMMEGTGALQIATGQHPGAMKDAVCSPGGTTIRGVSALEKAGFRGAVIAAVEAIHG